MTHTNLIIIGSGPGGYRAAKYAAENGLQVTVIEAAEAGGTCLNCGCIPTKSLAHDAERALEGAPANWQEALERKQGIVEQLRSAVEMILALPGITLVRGAAKFTDAHTVSVNGELYSADNIIIATGSSSKFPPGLSEELLATNAIGSGAAPAVVTSTELLSLPQLPEHLVIVGAGVIGMEFASVFNSYGVKVTVIEFLKECLPAVDSDVAKRARKQLEKRGIDFIMQAAVTNIADGAVTYERKGKQESIDADVVLVATGRKPNVQGLDLEAAGVAYDVRRGINVDDNMATNVPGIYAIGDVNGRMMLAHAATFQGFRAVNAILGKSDGIRLEVMPSAIFTYPEIACVGPSEQQCKDSGINYQLKKAMMRSNGRALAMDSSEGLIKLLADENGALIGCHAFGARASEIVQEVSSLICCNATLQQLADMVHIHPTISEMLSDMAR
ncbi:MAG: dihydrolipoyl dehydrogenase [Muribaculaceae bacterium]